MNEKRKLPLQGLHPMVYNYHGKLIKMYANYKNGVPHVDKQQLEFFLQQQRQPSNHRSTKNETLNKSVNLKQPLIITSSENTRTIDGSIADKHIKSMELTKNIHTKRNTKPFNVTTIIGLNDKLVEPTLEKPFVLRRLTTMSNKEIVVPLKSISTPTTLTPFPSITSPSSIFNENNMFEIDANHFKTGNDRGISSMDLVSIEPTIKTVNLNETSIKTGPTPSAVTNVNEIQIDAFKSEGFPISEVVKSLQHKSMNTKKIDSFIKSSMNEMTTVQTLSSLMDRPSALYETLWATKSVEAETFPTDKPTELMDDYVADATEPYEPTDYYVADASETSKCSRISAGRTHFLMNILIYIIVILVPKTMCMLHAPEIYRII